jgi:hypothetical protein
MMGSGTTLVEAVTAEREAIGFDIDPLAVLISTVKTTSLSSESLVQLGHEIVSEAKLTLSNGRSQLSDLLTSKFDDETKEFLDYWFAPETQVELMALRCEINKLRDMTVRRFFELALSAIIITKSGGVSLAWDLAHTRPHKLKQGLAKTPRPALADFLKRVARNAGSLSSIATSNQKAVIELGNAESLPTQSETIDLLFTSPPYASNAIDYMRASKFALVWLGYTISELKRLRTNCIGGESVRAFRMEELPFQTQQVIDKVATNNLKRGEALRRYYSEMTRVLAESHRVLKEDRAAVFVVGSAIMGGIDSAAQTCLSEIGQVTGFELVNIGVRRLDRNRRMLPVTKSKNGDSQIENRMHEEFVIGFYKPPKHLRANA